MERLSIDFKGPLPSNSRNKYFLTVVDEFSRFPFVYPCSDMTAVTAINCLTNLFSIFGMPAYIHSDRGNAFMSEEFKQFLSMKGIAQSKTTPYNPTGNSQCERYNGIVWKAITLTLHSRDLPNSSWEEVLPDALHSIRSLLCTASNATPHERLFASPRRSTNCSALPTWLTSPGKVLYKRQVRHSKYEPLVDEVDLLEANPQYSHIRFPSGNESTVSTKYLAPMGNLSEVEGETALQNSTPSAEAEKPDAVIENSETDETHPTEESRSQIYNEAASPTEKRPIETRRSARDRKPPTRYGFD